MSGVEDPITVISAAEAKWNEAIDQRATPEEKLSVAKAAFALTCYGLRLRLEKGLPFDTESVGQMIASTVDLAITQL